MEQFFLTVVRESMYSSAGRLRFYLSYLFQGVDFTGKSMVDIGGGSGLFSLYAACIGAQPVVCLEPEIAGSTAGASEKFKQMSELLGLNNVHLVPTLLQEYDPQGQTFDILFLHSSINHLDEEACINLRQSSDAQARYNSIFSQLAQMASPGATLVIADCSRYNFYALMHLRNPVAPTIEWHKHQSPKVWAQMLRNFGFASPQVRWSSFNALRQFGRLFLRNKIASYFLTSHFVLVMKKME